MRKLFVLGIICFISFSCVSTMTTQNESLYDDELNDVSGSAFQSRIDDAEPSEFILLGELTDATGWIKTNGIWRESPNKIIKDERAFIPDRFNNFNTIRLFETTYLNKKYIVLEINFEFSQRGGSYSWVGNQLLRSGSFSGNYRYYYIIDPRNFIIQVDGVRSTIIKNDILYLQSISNVEEDRDPTFSVWFKNMREYSFNTISIYTQYSRNDNLIRFYIGSAMSTSSLELVYNVMEDYYYECDANYFFDMFGQLIRR